MLDISDPTVLNNKNFCNQNCTLLPKYLPASFISSQHSDNHNSGPPHDVLKQTTSHSSRG